MNLPLALNALQRMLTHSSALPCFSNARTRAFIHELTDKQLDYVVARLLQLGHDEFSYSFVGAIRNLVGDSDKIEFGERK